MTEAMGPRDLNRTLLLRQHLLRRVDLPVTDLVGELLGLQAQENLPPYLSVAARLQDVGPWALSGALERSEVVRLVTLRGTLHVHLPEDAVALRRWVQPALDRNAGVNQQSRAARHLPVDALVSATRQALADGPLPVAELGERLALRFPDAPPVALVQAARERVPLVQVPPRGLWRRSGGVVYRTLEHHLGTEAPPGAENDVPDVPDVPGLVRRYLRAFGPATAADMTAWSRVTRLGPVFTALREELVEVACEDGRTRYDVPGAPYASADEPAPVRLLGTYDNLWLSHADREHVLPPDGRALWSAPNGAAGSVVLIDGVVAGLWWWREGRVVTELLRDPTRTQAAELGEEVEAMTALLGDDG